MKPRIALEALDGGEARLDKIVDLIRESKYAIHDISRIEASHRGRSQLLKNTCKLQAPGPTKISGAFSDFSAGNFDQFTDEGFLNEDIENLPIAELIECTCIDDATVLGCQAVLEGLPFPTLPLEPYASGRYDRYLARAASERKREERTKAWGGEFIRRRSPAGLSEATTHS